MATMSKLAYERFEEALPIDVAEGDVLKLVTGKENARDQKSAKKISPAFKAVKLVEILKNVAGSSERAENLENLKSNLNELQFKLLETFSVSIPLIADTQAFLAKIEADRREPFLVLSFRGTEPKSPTDIKNDLDAVPQILGALGGPGASEFIPAGEKLTPTQMMWPKVKVHPGFWTAFNVVRGDIEKQLAKAENKDLPLYLTGHSLGGALAVVATYALTSDHIAACYTFGGPRVGNLQFGQRIKPPVYRVINASDIVPRVPPGVLVDVITIMLRAIPAIPYLDKLADFLERFRGYRHYGDMRHLNAAPSVADQMTGTITYPKLIVRANPPQMSRWYWLARRWIATFGRAAVSDHAIDIYCDKLAYWASVRSK